MDLVIKFILELLLEGGMEVSSNKKVSKWIRYPILAIILLFFASVIFGIMIVGFSMFSESLLAGIFMIVVGLFLLGASIYNFRKKYLEVVNKK